MQSQVDTRPRSRPVGRDLLSSAPVLLLAFVLVHAVLVVAGLAGRGWAFGDVTSVYATWTYNALAWGAWPGITIPWVYPVLALVPMLLPRLLAGVDYTLGWMLWLTIFDILALLAFTRWGRDERRIRLAWFWVAFLAALGPVAIGRIDAMCVPLVLVTLDVVRRRPVVAGALLTVGVWIKIWPVAVLAGLFTAWRSRWRLLAGAAGLSVAVVILVGLLGHVSNAFSFVSGQTSRRLQIEAVAATPWLWAARTDPAISIVYNTKINTNEVFGPGSIGMSALLTPIMALMFIAVAVLALLAVRRGTSRRLVALHAALAFVLVLIVGNKVGSPQFQVWLLVPVLWGLVEVGRGFRLQAGVALACAALTQVVYPYLYHLLLGLEPWMLLVITARNVALVALLVWQLRELGGLLRRADGVDGGAGGAAIGAGAGAGLLS